MTWANRLARILLGDAFSPISRQRRSLPPKAKERRVRLEALEDRRLLSLTGTLDFGDAPDNYGTTLANDGACHEATGPILGATRDAELDGVPSVGADYDDTHSTADEDGVTFGTVFVGQLDAVATVNVHNAPNGAKLDAWIDFDADGSFGGLGEQVADAAPVSNGDNTISFDVPGSAVPGQTYARFRLSTLGDLGSLGSASDGEVEDLLLTIEPALNAGAFLRLEDITPNAHAAVSVSAADINGDGHIDMLSASGDFLDDAGEQRIAWYENDGSGNLTQHTIATSIRGPRSVHAADVNGDGNVDVLAAGFTDGEIVWYENDGNEDFTEHSVATSSVNIDTIATADFDGDGDVDLLSGNGSGSKVAWHENDGSGNFTERSCNTYSSYLAVADINGDGHEDLVCRSSGGNGISWFENDGSGNLVEHVVSTAHYVVSDLYAADINGDGHIDLASAYASASTIYWYENSGNGSFTEHTVATNVGLVESVFVTDVNGDGHADLLSASQDKDGIVWYENNGSENFTNHPITIAADGAKSVFAADINGDGEIDVLSASEGSDTIAWHENDGNENFDTHALTQSFGRNSAVFAADVNRDGHMDYVAGRYGRLVWYENDGNSRFSEHAINEASSGVVMSVAVADLNGDGAFDVVSTRHAWGSGYETAWYENNGSETFTKHAITEMPGYVAVADFNSDGHIDILASQLTWDASVPNDKIVWFENDGNANFSEHTISDGLDEPHYLAVVDIDGDGHIDALSRSVNDGKLAWYESSGSGNFLAHNITNSGSGDVAAADIDGNGHTDLITTLANPDRLVWFKNNGNASFVSQTVASLDSHRCRISTADVSGDGLTDILVAGDGQTFWFENAGNGTFTKQQVASAGANAIMAADVDGDRDLDILIAQDSSPDMPWYENLAVSMIDLGDVDFRSLSDLDLAAGERVYSFNTANTGYLTVDATFDAAAGSVTLRLLDSQGQIVDEVADGDGYLRIDHTDLIAGDLFELQVLGANPNVDLRICNLLSQSGTAVEVVDTPLDDVFRFGVSDTFDVTVNGVTYHFNDASTFTFTSESGNDSIEIVDSTGNDTLTVSDTQMVMTGTPIGGTSFSVSANNFSYAHGYARTGGNDVAQFAGSDRSDRAKVYDSLVKMMGGGYYARAKFFEQVDMNLRGDTDSTVVVASDRTDVLYAMKDKVQVSHDVKISNGSSPAFTTMAYDVTILASERVVARAKGGDDWVELHDSALNDVFIAKPHKVEMMNGPRDGVKRGSEYEITARGYGNVSAIADQGGEGDGAKLYDSAESGTDVWAAAYVDGQAWSSMSSPTRLLYEVHAFEQVGGYGFNGGLGQNHGTNQKEHAANVDFVFQQGYW